MNKKDLKKNDKPFLKIKKKRPSNECKTKE